MKMTNLCLQCAVQQECVAQRFDSHAKAVPHEHLSSLPLIGPGVSIIRTGCGVGIGTRLTPHVWQHVKMSRVPFENILRNRKKEGKHYHS